MATPDTWCNRCGFEVDPIMWESHVARHKADGVDVAARDWFPFVLGVICSSIGFLAGFLTCLLLTH